MRYGDLFICLPVTLVHHLQGQIGDLAGMQAGQLRLGVCPSFLALAFQLGVVLQRRRFHDPRRECIGLIVSVIVRAAHQCRRFIFVDQLANGRRDVLNVEADPPIIRSIRHRGVKCPTVVKGCLSWRQRAEHRVTLSYAFYGLPSEQDVAVVI